MAWYRSGTVSMVNGSAVVAGAQTDFVANTSPGEAFLAPDGKTYEVAAIVSATQLVLGGVYQGPTAQNQGYAILPTQSFARDLALGAAQLLNTFANVRDGIGAGLFPEGSAAAPSLRFANDLDTGIRRAGENNLSLVTGGVDRLSITAAGGTLYGNTLELAAPEVPSLIFSRQGVGSWFTGGTGVAGANDYAIRFNGTRMLSLDTGGNMLVGSATGTSHIIRKDNAAGGLPILQIQQGGALAVAAFYAVDFNGVNDANPANSAAKIGKQSTGRSLSASGTINANGADYAEYMAKAKGCGAIAKGDVCGVDVDGFLTRSWSTAVSFVVKSTDPSLVGGDVWAAGLDPRPEQPGPEPVEPSEGPSAPGDDATDEAVAAYVAAADAFASAVAAFPAEHAAWEKLQAKYKTDLVAWEKELEAARACVDRIAFCGQVPVNVSGEFAVGDYIVAMAAGSGIKAVAVPDAEITFEQYRKRIGKVWAIRDGRAWIDVQHG